MPSNIHAVLQQATVLGDTYVALERAQDAGPRAAVSGPAGESPMTQTTSPPQLEDTIANTGEFHRQRIDPASAKHGHQYQQGDSAPTRDTPNGVAGGGRPLRPVE